MEAATSFANRPIPPNAEDSTPLLLWEALAHIIQTHPIKHLTRPVFLVAAFILLGAGLLLFPPTTLGLLSGMVLAALAILAAYLIWYGRFVKLNNECGVLCVRCTSRMWQLCCARCREPVPPLTLMPLWGGLTTCPHCGLRLSCSAGTLLAWCSTCHGTQPRPDRFYRKRMVVMVWVVHVLPEPDKVRDGWEVTAYPSPSRMLLFRGDDPHSNCLLLLVDYKQEKMLNFDRHIEKQNWRLLVSDGIPEMHINRYKSVFPQKSVSI
jgi:hypothetical protein